MPSLPNNPNLDHFRRQAKSLLRQAKPGDEHALELIVRPQSDAAAPNLLTLAAAQFAVARGHGFSSWPRLKHYLDTAQVLRRDPTTAPAEPDTDPADTFCRLACLVYSEQDGPDRWAAARDLLAEHPAVVSHSMAAAAAAADPDAIRGHLAADRRAATTDTGPHRWAPLMYLTYSRVGRSDEPAERFLLSARLLLDAGADPDPGYLWLGLPTPSTALTGVFGEGEQGPGRQPRHPHSLALARLLLTRGPTRTTDKRCTTGCSGPMTVTWSCCSSSASGAATVVRGSVNWARPRRRRPRCWPGNFSGQSTTASLSGSTCWPATASTCALR